ncbi:FAD-dependent oxidoreductase [Paenibacillus mendelii]|uniref:FAD-dependent oxidoreductase n=1 Tax=Paenibacillus mendelii TaxID=206163 RepID=A0ABV6JAF6_9BACL|nr:FAD-dependent oxidoreductase [Paenibacillus mendelii]MCQ6560745.1 FAD-dependent oxidoreductase [Paenibacillus mendelii]
MEQIEYKAVLDVEAEYDVIVFGGGAAGCAAAIQAAREGARTALIEKNGILGGTTVVASVNFPGLFHTRLGRQVIAGIGWEIIEATVARGGAVLPDFSIPYKPKHHPQHHILVNRFIYSTVLDDLCLEAGVQLRFHEMPVHVRQDADGVIVVVAGKSGPEALRAKVVVDATGDANVAEMMAYPLEQSTSRQPGTLIYHLTGYDLNHVTPSVLQALYDEALAAGDVLVTDHSHADREHPPFWRELRSGGGNHHHITGIDGSTSRTKTEAELKARAALMRAYRFLRTVPGCENLSVDYVASECGIRDTKRIVGQTRITGEAYKTGYVWNDAVCYSYYPIDIHQHNGNAIDIRPLEDGVVATIPYGALIPQGSDRLIMAGRSISGDDEANSAYRVQASCSATGQVAGVAAVMAAKMNIPVGHVDIDVLREKLEANGAIVPRQ